MRNYQWWQRQKKRVKKKYKLLSGAYLSPKDQKNIGRMLGFWLSIVTDEFYKVTREIPYILRGCADEMLDFADPTVGKAPEEGDDNG